MIGEAISLHDGGDIAVTVDDRRRRHNELKLDARMQLERVQHRLDARIARACRHDHTDFTNHGLWRLARLGCLQMSLFEWRARGHGHP